MKTVFLHVLGLWLLSSAYCNFQHTDPIHVLLDLYLIFNFLQSNCECYYAFCFSFQVFAVSIQKCNWVCMLILDPVTLLNSLILQEGCCHCCCSGTFFGIFYVDNITWKQRVLYFLFQMACFLFLFLVCWTG